MKWDGICCSQTDIVIKAVRADTVRAVDTKTSLAHFYEATILVFEALISIVWCLSSSLIFTVR